MTARSTLPLLALLLLAGCSYDLEHHLDEKDANDIYALLAKNGINAKKSLEDTGNEPTYMITVAKTDAAQAAELLREHALPRPKPGGLHSIIQGKGMIPTEVEQRAMLLDGYAGEIEQALDRVDGVLDASAMVNIPPENDLAEKKPANTASVLVRYRPNIEGKPPVDEEHIRDMVARALPDTQPQNVTVIMVPAQPASADISDGSQMKTVLGMQMTAASVAQFRMVVAVMGAAMLAMLLLTAVMFMRGSGSAPPARR